MLQNNQWQKRIIAKKLKNFATSTLCNFVTSKNRIFAAWKQTDRKKLVA